ncbi:hypothetical protein [Mycobacterium sp. 48b]|uniref:hypothetical protein n=1 Tax=Mycobacterium sp. 48b TaxID=3400426 RepID=UPI003AAE77D7
MSARRYTQAQIERAFAEAEASADKNGVLARNRDAYVLGFLSSRFNVTIGRFAVSS